MLGTPSASQETAGTSIYKTAAAAAAYQTHPWQKTGMDVKHFDEQRVDLVVQVSTSGQWAKLLKAPLERAAAKGTRGLAQKVVGAGAEIGMHCIRPFGAAMEMW